MLKAIDNRLFMPAQFAALLNCLGALDLCIMRLRLTTYSVLRRTDVALSLFRRPLEHHKLRVFSRRTSGDAKRLHRCTDCGTRYAKYPANFGGQHLLIPIHRSKEIGIMRHLPAWRGSAFDALIPWNMPSLSSLPPCLPLLVSVSAHARTVLYRGIGGPPLPNKRALAKVTDVMSCDWHTNSVSRGTRSVSPLAGSIANG